MWLSEMVWFFSTWTRPLVLKLSQLESGLNRQNSNPIWEHGSKPSSPGCSTFFLKKNKTSANGILSQHCKHAVFLSLSKHGWQRVTPQGRNMQQSVSQNSSNYRSSLFHHSRKGTLDTAGSVNPQLHFFFWSSPLLLFDNANLLGQ